MTTHLRTCNLCEAMCGLAVEVKDGAVHTVRGDADDVLSHGHICPKAYALKTIHEDPDRLKRPQKRIGDRWVEIDWETALDEAVAGMKRVQAEHGPNALAVYVGNPNVHNYGSLIYGKMLLRTLGTKNRYSATSLDQLPHMLASYLMFGHQLLLPVPDVERTDYLLMLGANPVVSGGSLMSAGNTSERLAAIKRRGKVVCVDPRRTRSAEAATEHLAIRPGTDALFLAALVNEALSAGAKLGTIAGFTDGVDAVKQALEGFTADTVAGPTGIPAGTIRRVAAEFRAAKRAVCYGRLGVCTQLHGGLATWLINVLNAITGRLDVAGGAMFAKPAIDVLALGGRGAYARRHTRVRGLPEFGGEYPAATLAEEMDTPGEGQIRALFTSAGNPVLSAPNGRRLERALAGLDFMVCVDIYRNETTRFANLILPPTFGLEHDHYDLIFHALAVRNTAKYSEPLFERAPDQRHDWEILLGLLTRLKAGPTLGAMLDGVMGRLPGKGLGAPHRLLDVGLRRGPYGRGLRPGGLTLKKLRDSPHGVDLGPLQPALPDTLFTKDKRVNLAPEPYLADLPRLRALLEPSATQRAYVLLGRRTLRSNNSWMHNATPLVKGRNRCTLQMHPADAAGLNGGGVADGAMVHVTSDVGQIEAELEITDRVAQGVVSLPHGWGHGRAGTQMKVAAAAPGVSLNDLTDDALVDPLTGNAAFTSVRVDVKSA